MKQSMAWKRRMGALLLGVFCWSIAACSVQRGNDRSSAVTESEGGEHLSSMQPIGAIDSASESMPNPPATTMASEPETRAQSITIGQTPTTRVVRRGTGSVTTTAAEPFAPNAERAKKALGDTMASNITQKQYVLSFVDDFNGTSLNTSNWKFDGDGDPQFGEMSQPIEGEVTVENGRLVLRARQNGPAYTGAAISTFDKETFRYGRVEMLAKLPQGNGVAASFRTVGTMRSWPYCGSIEVLRFLGSTDRSGDNINGDSAYAAVLHWTPRNGDGTQTWSVDFGGYRTAQSIDSAALATPEKLGDMYHVYGVEWTRERVYAYFDYELVGSAPIEHSDLRVAFHQLHYLVLSLSIGGRAGLPNDLTVFPQEFLVDWVKVWT